MLGVRAGAPLVPNYFVRSMPRFLPKESLGLGDPRPNVRPLSVSKKNPPPRSRSPPPPIQIPSSSSRGRTARQSPFFRDLASPIPSHRGGPHFASPAAALPSATPPLSPVFTLDDRFAAADFLPDPTASDLLPVASSPSPRAGTGTGSRSPSWDRSRGKK
uniref:Uncharacterized protein n=2 Tax=Aegilops tauschii subsp. strangulata TaxID=200361 RepID=A0A453L8X6_AEGTS